MANEIEKSGQRMAEALAKLRQDRAAELRRPSPAVSFDVSYSAPPAVFLEWGVCAVHDRPFYTRIERQASGLYLRVACVRAHEGEDYGGVADSRVLRLDRIRGRIGPCPWCGDRGGQYECDCSAVVCGGRVDARRKWFRCRDSCGRVWKIGEPATETQVSEEARQAGQWKAPARDAGIWKAPAHDNPSRMLLPPARRK
jgi:hypothetical protein